jgi:acyl-CoA dehydrogenase
MSGDLSHDNLAAPFERLLEAHCTPRAVRAIEAEESGVASANLWRVLHESGFIDALVPEALGGAGLNLASVHRLIESCGRHALPLPLGETMVARALLVHAGHAPPPDPITLGCAVREGGAIAARLLPFARAAQWALLSFDDVFLLLPCAQARRSLLAPNACAGELRWPAGAPDAIHFPGGSASLLHAQACVLAAQIAGALSRVFELTLRYANERVQFGKPIGKFQAVQHQISVMAEHSAMASAAARMGCDAPAHLPNPQRAAIAKAVTSESAAGVAALGHALHGAIGMTEEYDLQLYTRRLHEWRLCAGSESYWQQRIGADLLAADASALDFVRASVDPRTGES